MRQRAPDWALAATILTTASFLEIDRLTARRRPLCLRSPGRADTAPRSVDPMSRRQILVTNALPYVNGHLHLGHLVEHVQTNIWVRFQRLRGHEVGYFCGDDTHGTATMIRASAEGREPEELLAEMSAAHQQDLKGFGVVYDHYGSTHSPSNERLVGEIWQALRDAGRVVEREVRQLYDVEVGSFLADRFVQGTCPRCGASDQAGDNCELCGAVYGPEELIDPISTLSGTTPEVRSAPHFFVTLADFQEFLTQWTQQPGILQPEIANWLKGAFLSEPLRDWDVSRPAPYFGFEIPDAPGHYFYVWVDAPVGYMSATWDWCQKSGDDFDRWWRNPDCEIRHFIGKDITYFHTLFWPAMLKTAGYELPRSVHVHGFLTVNGEKMSKRRGTYVLVRTYLEYLNPEYLRYYYASKLGRSVSDIDLNMDELVAKVNSDLVGKVANLASRTARFLEGQTLSDPYPEDGGLFADAAKRADDIAAAYEACDTNRVARLVMALADRANEYVEAAAPWALRKQEGKEEEIRAACSVALNLFHQITLYLEPILPDLSVRARALLGIDGNASWEDVQSPLVGNAVAKFEHLMQRVDPERIKALVAASAEETG